MIEQALAIRWYKGKIIERIEFVDYCSCRQRLGCIVREPACDIRIERIRYSIEKILRKVSADS